MGNMFTAPLHNRNVKGEGSSRLQTGKRARPGHITWFLLRAGELVYQRSLQVQATRTLKPWNQKAALQLTADSKTGGEQKGGNDGHVILCAAARHTQAKSARGGTFPGTCCTAQHHWGQALSSNTWAG
jgi:hypothetical protein